MPDLPVTGAVYPTPEEVHAQLLSDLRYGYGRIGITINVARGSELWERTWAVANRVSLAIANGAVGLQDTNPVDATGNALTEWAATFGVTPRPAVSASGFVEVEVNSPATTVFIPASFQCTAPDGLKYQTTVAGTYADEALVQVQAVDTGDDTDQDADTIVTWDSAAIAFLGIKATVAAGGLDGGRDADDEETLRARLLSKLSFPAVGGNWAHVKDLAESASAAVVFAAVYPTVRGPASYDVAIVGEYDDPVLNTTTVNQVAAAVSAEMPGSANLNLTPVVEEELDIIVNLNLPLPIYVGGAGGGWHDATPWPSTAEAGAVYARVLSVTVATNTIRVDSTVADPPLAGNRFSIWNPAGTSPSTGLATGVMVDFAILTVTPVGPPQYDIVIDSQFSQNLSFVATGMYCSAGAVNLQNYAEDFVSSMALLGPGEKTSNADILVYGRRKPTFDRERPQSVTSTVLTDLQAQHDEILDLSFAARLNSGLATTRTTPSVPSIASGSPRMLTLTNLSFRRQV
jgi:uncharacterized phage protein gp47/JayE